MPTEQSRCSRCHRTLRTIRCTTEDGQPIGPVCARRARAEAQYKPAQIEKAKELVELRAIASTPIRTARGRRVFVVIASSGTDRYFATRTACTCPAGLKVRRCYHRLAVTLAA